MTPSYRINMGARPKKMALLTKYEEMRPERPLVEL
jgi:hypothetical protein